jgi:hypothetical protein
MRSLVITITLLALGMCETMLLNGCGAGQSKSAPIEHLPMIKAGRVKMVDSPDQLPSGGQLSAASWVVASQPSGRRIEIQTEQGYCVGDPPPSLAAALVEEHGPNVYVVAYVEAVESARKVCRGVGAFQNGVLVLRSPVKNLRIFDARNAPAKLRWTGDDVWGEEGSS